MLFNKKTNMMIKAVEIKLALIKDLRNNLGRDSINYDCYAAQEVILKEVLKELKMIKDGKAIVKA